VHVTCLRVDILVVKVEHISMQELDLLFRIVGAVIFLMTGLFVLRDASRLQDKILFFLFVLGLAAYIIGNAADRGFIVPNALVLPRAVVSGNFAFVYWWFSRSLFEDDFRLGRFEVSVAAAWASVFLARLFWSDAPINLSWISTGFGLVLVAHVSWLLLTERSGDLVPRRRNARLVFAAIPSAFFLLDLIIDILFGFNWKPLWFTVWQNGAIMLVALAMVLWLLRVEGTMFAEQALPGAAPEPQSKNDKLRARLLRVMEDEKPYLDPSLTFDAFARQLSVGQIRLRALINQELGYRHFRNFLNAWRVNAAKDMLTDPARAGDKIIAIAFDAGFASLASFNRAFLVHQNESPSSYRANARPNESAEKV